MAGSVIVGGARTPIGKLMGSLSSLSAVQLGEIAIRAALERTHTPPDAVEHVIMGQVLTAGAGQIPARQAAAGAGIPASVPALTVNKVCLSGLQSIILADQLISSGQCEVVVAGGMESMSQAPHLLVGSRRGYKYGPVTIIDHLENDGLRDSFTDSAMGLLTELANEAERVPVSRAEQDRFAARSHQRAAKAQAEALFTDEIVPVVLTSPGGQSITVRSDEGIRAGTDEFTLAGLRGAFREDGTITAGNASPISDGAAAVVMMSRDRAEAAGVEWLAEVVGIGMVAGPDSSLQPQPANAILAAAKGAGFDAQSELDLAEVNEAFAAVGVIAARQLGIDPDIVNVNGGAIALGHPIGMSGTRLALHLGLELARRGGGLGAAALCGGGGQGDAVLLRVPVERAS